MCPENPYLYPPLFTLVWFSSEGSSAVAERERNRWMSPSLLDVGFIQLYKFVPVNRYSLFVPSIRY